MHPKRFAMAWILFLLIPLAGATAQGNLALEARAGFDSVYKIGSWVPVQILAINEGSPVQGELQVSAVTGPETLTLYTQRVSLASQSRKQFTFALYIDSFAQQIQVRLIDGNRKLAELQVQIRPLSTDTFLIAIASDDPTALSYLAALPEIGGRRVQVAHVDPADLPAQGRILDSLDALAIHSMEPSALSQEQRDALRGWTAFGGHLVICGGPNAPATAAGLEGLLPARIAGSRTTVEIDALGDLAGAPFLAGMPAVVAELVPLDGAVVINGEPGLPLVIRQGTGTGWVDMLAVDPDLEPLRTWIGVEAMWTSILSPPPTGGSRSWTTDLGSSWSSTYSALANIPGLDAPSVLLVIAFLFIYVTVIGPLNFAVLKLLDKQSLAWITVPAAIVVFTGVAYAAGMITRGRQVVVSQVSVVQLRPETGMAAVDSLIGIYSPNRSAYDVRLPDRTLVRAVTDPYGGLGSGAGSAIQVEPGPPTLVRQLEVDVGAMRYFGAQSVVPWPAIESQLVLRRMTEVGAGSPTIYRVEGTLSNRSQETLRHCALVFGSTAIELPDLKGGETAPIGLDFEAENPRELYLLLDDLAGPGSVIGNEQRERERRRSLLEGFIAPQMYSMEASQSPFGGLSLVGWTDASPISPQIDRIASQTEATTLVVAPLSLSTAQGDLVLLPKGFATWELIAGNPDTTPYRLYSYQSAPTFRFHLANPQIPETAEGVLQSLILHINTPGPSFGAPPVVLIWNVVSGQWETLAALEWGANPIPDPDRYVEGPGMAGSIQISVETLSISDRQVAIDVEAIGRHR